jgi:hypothetical protein
VRLLAIAPLESNALRMWSRENESSAKKVKDCPLSILAQMLRLSSCKAGLRIRLPSLKIGGTFFQLWHEA